MRIFRLALIACCVALSSCGYSMTRILPSQYRTICIESFHNDIGITHEVSEYFGYQANLPELEEKVSRGVINRFLFDGNLRVTPKREKADLVLEGTIHNFTRQPVRRQDDDSIEEYRLNLGGSITVRDREGKVIVDEPNLVGDVSYFLTGAQAKAESVAVDDLITDFSRRIVERVVENW